jgi:hypothetical protein
MTSSARLITSRTWLSFGAVAVALVAGLGLPRPFVAAEGAKDEGGFSVGNHLIARKFRVINGQVFTASLKARTETAVTSAEFEVVCRAGEQEVVLNRYNTTAKGFTASPTGTEAALLWWSEAPALEIRVMYRTDGERPYIFKWLEIANRGSQPVRILRATVDALEVTSGPEPLRGGVGQPIVLKNELFLGIEHPAAANEVRAKGMTLSHYPDAEIAPGDTWTSKRAVLGAAGEPGESVEDAFRHYLVNVTGRPPSFAPIYNDWGAHDELGTLVKPQLTEQLTNELLDVLQVMKANYGTQLDYYVLDAFWYDPQGAYISFKQPNWPRGYEPALERMRALGMKPGLWFDLGGGTLDLKNTPGWQGPESPCLSDPEFARLLEHAIEVHVREHSLSLLKFDFANLLCQHGAGKSPSLSVLEKNADRLRQVCDEARRANPAMAILAFNTFSLVEMMESTKRYDEAYAVSPWWVLWFDALYSGDPRPSELPSVTSLRDSSNWYQDHVFRGFARSLLPLFMIDDCGTIIGKTSTIYYLGAEGFTDSWILNIMRGAHSPILYGDLRLLSENDKKFLAASIRFLRAQGNVLAHTRPILGIPGKGEVYGYLTQSEDLAFVTLVNPHLYAQSFAVPVGGPAVARGFRKLVFSNDGQAREGIRPVNGVLSGKLIPGEIRIYALGTREKVAPLFLPPAPTREYHEATPVADPFAGRKEAQLKIAPQQAGKTLAVIIQYQKGGEPDRSYDRPQEIMQVTGETATGPIRFSSIPREGTDIWSKCSWAIFKHKVAPVEINQTLHLRLVGEPPVGTTWTVQAMWLK